MNLAKLAADVEMEEEEYLEFCNLFVRTGIKDLRTLWTAVKSNDGATVAEAAHSLKGASINLGLRELHETAKRVELIARRQGVTPEASRLVRELARQMEVLARLMREQQQK